MNIVSIIAFIFILIYYIRESSSESTKQSNETNNNEFNDIVGDADTLGKWIYSNECDDGIATQMNIVETPLVFVYTISHHALEFRVLCRDSRVTNLTVEFSPVDVFKATLNHFGEVDSNVKRRFGHYQKILYLRNPLIINLSIKEIYDITSTTKKYKLSKYNCQDYASEIYSKMEAKYTNLGK